MKDSIDGETLYSGAAADLLRLLRKAPYFRKDLYAEETS